MNKIKSDTCIVFESCVLMPTFQESCICINNGYQEYTHALTDSYSPTVLNDDFLPLEELLNWFEDFNTVWETGTYSGEIPDQDFSNHDLASLISRISGHWTIQRLDEDPGL